MSVETVEHRRHLRHVVNEPCRALVDGDEIPGAVVNMSVSGAAIVLDVELGVEAEPGVVIELQADRIIRPIASAASRPGSCGRWSAASPSNSSSDKDRALIAALWRVLNEYAPSADRA